MNQETQKRLAESLTAESTDIIPFLPYLLQDFWSLGCEPEEMISLLRGFTDFGPYCRLLDLACGKGAAAIHITKEFGCTAKGIDITPEFVAEAEEKATEYGVAHRCSFVTGDVNEAVFSERGYDLVIWGAAGDLLGDYPRTLACIANTVKSGSYILFDDGYISDNQQKLRFHHDYLTLDKWRQAFRENNLTVVACKEFVSEIDPSAYGEDLGNICRRAKELIMRFPDKERLFSDYARSQQAEYEDLQDGFTGALWLLQKNDTDIQ